MKLKEEQTRVIAHDGGELLVSASAGSGKTFTMIRRLIRLISSGKAKVSEILSVTFTEKAAAEMRAKLLDALLEEAAAGNAALAAQIADVYTADISTVHAFCGKLLRKYFFDAGLSPDFDIADESLASELKERALDGLFEELYEKKDEDFLLLASRHSRRRKDGELRGIVLSLYETARSEADFSGTLSKAEAQYTREKAEFFYGELQKPLLAAYAEYAGKFAMFAEAFQIARREKTRKLRPFSGGAGAVARKKQRGLALPAVQNGYRRGRGAKGRTFARAGGLFRRDGRIRRAWRAGRGDCKIPLVQAAHRGARLPHAGVCRKVRRIETRAERAGFFRPRTPFARPSGKRTGARRRARAL